MTEQMPGDDQRKRVEARRERLREVVDRLERALSAPAGGDLAIWRVNVATVCDDLDEALDEHIVGAEDELFVELRETAPHVGHRIDRLTAEHPQLVAALEELRASLTPDEPVEDAVGLARERGLTLIGALLRHRQAGADLLYEAYWVDVSTAD